MRVVFPTPGAPVTNTILGFSRFWFRRNPPHFETKAKIVHLRSFWATCFRFQQLAFLEELVSFVLKPPELGSVEEFDERVSPLLENLLHYSKCRSCKIYLSSMIHIPCSNDCWCQVRQNHVSRSLQL